MHFDHIGWNTRWISDAWVPTFPKARYLFGRIGWDHWRHEIDQASASDEIELRGPLKESVAPIIEAGLHDLIETDHRITDEVRLFPTPGHTPGHVSVAILSRDQKAVIAGDVMHHPIQLADAGIQSNFDSDRTQAEATRRAFIEDYGDGEVLVLGTHFAKPTGGWIVRDGAGWRFASSPKSLGT
jgi:glyoxylase-like metal-dependent hydrolase (beta-lactamase superfamily II)